MSLVAHKYTPAEMPERELEATFAARTHTLDYLLKVIRDQSQSGTLSSVVITGPRGAGKSTIIRMATLRIRQDRALSAAWIPVLFTEEQFDVASLRDLLAATLRVLSQQGSPLAGSWLAKVAAERDEEQSQQLAITGLGEVTRQSGKRLILIVENLDALLERRLDDQMKGTLRRLLMIDPFMMLIGSSVHVFNSLKRYDEAFFNYFGQVPLDRLTADEVFDLLTRRARFHENERFLRELPQQHAKVRAIVHLSGGNPRLVLMLYELLSQRQVTTIVQYLRRLVDELTPLLKDEMERLPPQQQKIVHALMEKGGTAQPTDLVEATRLPLNAVTSQLRRLKDAQIVEVLGGGKGRAAYYTVPDKLFAIWYQMRYLNQNRRRIELFVDVLRVWFDEEERWKFVTGVSASVGRHDSSGRPSADSAATVEYFAASLKGSQYERTAADLCIGQFAKLDLREAALVHSDFASSGLLRGTIIEPTPYTKLASWLIAHDNIAGAEEAVGLVLADGSRSVEDRCDAFLLRARIKRQQGDLVAAISDYTAVTNLPSAPVDRIARALGIRGIVKGQRGDLVGLIADYTALVSLPGAPSEQVARGLIRRGIAREEQRDVAGAIADFSAVLDLPFLPVNQVADALGNRGVTTRRQGELIRALADFTAVMDLPGVPVDQVARALLNRGITKGQQGDVTGEIADYTAALELPGAPADEVAQAYVYRGITKGQLADVTGEIADYNNAVRLPGAPVEEVAGALVNRGIAKGRQGDMSGEIADYTLVVNLPGAPSEQVAQAFLYRGITKGQQGDVTSEILDYTAAVELPGAPPEEVTRALVNRGTAKGRQGDVTGEIADYTLVVELRDAPTTQIAHALFRRGVAKGQQGDVVGEISDYTLVVELPGASAEQVGQALFNRGVTKGQQGDLAGAAADYTSVVALPGAPLEAVGRALVNRGLEKRKQGDQVGAISDYSAVLQMAGVPAKTVARALLGRARSYLGIDQARSADDDLVAVLESEGSPDDVLVAAAGILFGSLWNRNEEQAKVAVLRLGARMSSLPHGRAREIALRLLGGLASPELREAWPTAWRALADSTHGETKQTVEMFRGVCEVLDGADRAVLDRLPPEEREFVTSVLQRFDNDNGEAPAPETSVTT